MEERQKIGEDRYIQFQENVYQYAIPDITDLSDYRCYATIDESDIDESEPYNYLITSEKYELQNIGGTNYIVFDSSYDYSIFYAFKLIEPKELFDRKLNFNTNFDITPSNLNSELDNIKDYIRLIQNDYNEKSIRVDDEADVVMLPSLKDGQLWVKKDGDYKAINTIGVIILIDNVDMQGYRIINLGVGVDPEDAVNKHQLDLTRNYLQGNIDTEEAERIAGDNNLQDQIDGITSSDLNMEGNKIINLGDGVNNKDAINKSQLDDGLSGKSDITHTHSELHWHDNFSAIDKVRDDGRPDYVLSEDGIYRKNYLAKWGFITGSITSQGDLMIEFGKKAELYHTHNISEITDLDTELSNRPTMSEHIDFGHGTTDAGKPIKLNGNGIVDNSLLDIEPMWKNQGLWNPSTGTEYPDVSDPVATPINSFWQVDGVGTGYTFTSGDLAGKTVTDDTAMIWQGEFWYIRKLSLDPSLFYKLDGTEAIIANFAGGGYRYTYMGDGINPQDGINKRQLDSVNSALQDNIDTEESERITGDNALSDRIDNITGDYVNVTGDTMTGSLKLIADDISPDSAARNDTIRDENSLLYNFKALDILSDIGYYKLFSFVFSPNKPMTFLLSGGYPGYADGSKVESFGILTIKTGNGSIGGVVSCKASLYTSKIYDTDLYVARVGDTFEIWAYSGSYNRINITAQGALPPSFTAYYNEIGTLPTDNKLITTQKFITDQGDQTIDGTLTITESVKIAPDDTAPNSATRNDMQGRALSWEQIGLDDADLFPYIPDENGGVADVEGCVNYIYSLMKKGQVVEEYINGGNFKLIFADAFSYAHVKIIRLNFSMMRIEFKEYNTNRTTERRFYLSGYLSGGFNDYGNFDYITDLGGQTINGTLVVTGNITTKDPTVGNHVATKGYVDNLDVYSKAEINNLLSGKADLTGANFTGAITSTSDITAFLGTSQDGVSPDPTEEELQEAILENELMRDKAIARGYTSLVNKYNARISELETQLANL